MYLETVGEACVTEIFARGKPEEQKAAIAIETDAAAARHVTLNVEVMPENFEGRSYRTQRFVRCSPRARQANGRRAHAGRRDSGRLQRRISIAVAY